MDLPGYDAWKLASPPDGPRCRPGRSVPQRRTVFVLEFYVDGAWTADPEGRTFPALADAFDASDGVRDVRISTISVPA